MSPDLSHGCQLHETETQEPTLQSWQPVVKSHVAIACGPPAPGATLQHFGQSQATQSAPCTHDPIGPIADGGVLPCLNTQPCFNIVSLTMGFAVTIK